MSIAAFITVSEAERAAAAPGDPLAATQPRVDPANLDAYRAAHAAVWPELLHALKDAGWNNYSLHLGDD